MCFVQKRLCFSSLTSKFKPLNRLGFDENIKRTSGTILHKVSVCYTIYSSLNWSKVLFLQGKCRDSLGSALHAGAILQLGFKSIAKNTNRETECKLRETILFFNAAIYGFIIVKMIRQYYIVTLLSPRKRPHLVPRFGRSRKCMRIQYVLIEWWLIDFGPTFF